MIRIFCDICGKELDEFHSDSISLDFNCYGVTGFVVILNKKEYRNKSLQLCVDCANAVVSEIEDLQKLAKMDKEHRERIRQKIIEEGENA